MLSHAWPVSAHLLFTQSEGTPRPIRAGSRFTPRPEERLLSVVHALLHRCYKLPISNAAQVGTLSHASALVHPT